MPTPEEYAQAVAASRAGKPATPPVGGAAPAASTFRPISPLEMADVPTDGMYSNMVDAIKNNVIKDITSIPYIIPALLHPFHDATASPEENEKRRRAVGLATFALADFGLGYLAAGIARGAPAAFGWLRHSVLSTAAIQSGASVVAAEAGKAPGEQLDLGQEALYGALGGAVFGGAGTIWRKMKGKLKADLKVSSEPGLGTIEEQAKALVEVGEPYPGDIPEARAARAVWEKATPEARLAAHKMIQQENFNRYMGPDTPAGKKMAEVAQAEPVSKVEADPRVTGDTHKQLLGQFQAVLRTKKWTRDDLGHEAYQDLMSKMVGRKVDSSKEFTLDELRKNIKALAPEVPTQPMPAMTKVKSHLWVPRRGGGHLIFPDGEHVEFWNVANGKSKATPERMAEVAEKIGVTMEELPAAANLYKEMIQVAQRKLGTMRNIEIGTYKQALDNYPMQLDANVQSFLAALSREEKPAPTTKGEVNRRRAQSQVGKDAVVEGSPSEPGPTPGEAAAAARVAAARAPVSRKEGERMAKEAWDKMEEGPITAAYTAGKAVGIESIRKNYVKGTKNWFLAMEREIEANEQMLRVTNPGWEKIKKTPGEIERLQKSIKEMVDEYNVEVEKWGIRYDRPGGPSVGVTEMAPGTTNFLKNAGEGMQATEAMVKKGNRLRGYYKTYWKWNDSYEMPELGRVVFEPYQGRYNPLEPEQVKAVIDDSVAKALWEMYHSPQAVRKVVVAPLEKRAIEAMKRAEQNGLVAADLKEANVFNLTSKASTFPKKPEQGVFHGKRRGLEAQATQALRATAPPGARLNRWGIEESTPGATLTEQGYYVPPTVGGRKERLREAFRDRMKKPENRDPIREDIKAEAEKQGIKLTKEEIEDQVQANIRAMEKANEHVFDTAAQNEDEYKTLLDAINPPPKEPAPRPPKGSKLQRPGEIQPAESVAEGTTPAAAGPPKNLRQLEANAEESAAKEPFRVDRSDPKNPTFVGFAPAWQDAEGAIHVHHSAKGDDFKYLKQNPLQKGWYHYDTGKFLKLADLEDVNGDLEKAILHGKGELVMKWAEGAAPKKEIKVKPKRPMSASERGTLQRQQWEKELKKVTEELEALDKAKPSSLQESRRNVRAKIAARERKIELIYKLNPEIKK